jgi:hypothetical protein
VFVVGPVLGGVAGGPFVFARERLVLVNMGDAALSCLHARGRLCDMAVIRVWMRGAGTLALGWERRGLLCWDARGWWWPVTWFFACGGGWFWWPVTWPFVFGGERVVVEVGE